MADTIEADIQCRHFGAPFRASHGGQILRSRRL